MNFPAGETAGYHKISPLLTVKDSPGRGSDFGEGVENIFHHTPTLPSMCCRPSRVRGIYGFPAAETKGY